MFTALRLRIHMETRDRERREEREKEKKKEKEREDGCLNAVVPQSGTHPASSFLAFQQEAGASLTTGSFGLIDIICYH